MATGGLYKHGGRERDDTCVSCRKEGRIGKKESGRKGGREGGKTGLLTSGRHAAGR